MSLFQIANLNEIWYGFLQFGLTSTKNIGCFVLIKPKILEMSQAIIHPRKGRTEAPLGPVAVMVAIEKDLTLLRRLMGIRGSASRRILTSRLYEITLGGQKITLAGPMVGAPYAVLILEKLIVLGAQKILFWGWCGSIQESLSIGDFLIPERGIIGEGTSPYYFADKSKRESRASAQVSKALDKACGDHPLPFQTGSVWSTDAPYRETAQQVLSLKKKGVMAVDMESSAIFSVSRFRRVQAGALLVVSDELSSLKWKTGFSDRNFNTSRKRASEIIVQTCRTLGASIGQQ
jgi:uridine phosphorylase